MWKRRISWLIVLVCALGLYLFENNAGTRILLCAGVCLPLCALALLFLPRQRLSAELEVPPSLTRGERAMCALTLGNGAFLPLASVGCALEIDNLLTGERSRLELVGAVGARGTAQIPFSIEARHCGRLDIRVTGLKVEDPFGLFTRRANCDLRRTADVPPEVSPVELATADTADFLSDSQRYSTRKPGYDPSETFCIREYAPGDPIRQIHWKLSEKTGTVLVRDFGLPVVDQMLLLLETTALESAPVTPEDMDQMLDLLFSLSQALLALDISHTVGWQECASAAYEAREIHGADDLEELQGLLLANPIGPGAATVAGCYGQGHLQCAYAHVAVLSPYLAPDISALCHGNRVTVLLPGGGVSALDKPENNVFTVPFTARELREGGLNLEL